MVYSQWCVNTSSNSIGFQEPLSSLAAKTCLCVQASDPVVFTAASDKHRQGKPKQEMCQKPNGEVKDAKTLS